MPEEIHGVVEQSDDLDALVIEPKNHNVSRTSDPVAEPHALTAMPNGVQMYADREIILTDYAGAHRMLSQIDKGLPNQPRVSVGRS